VGVDSRSGGVSGRTIATICSHRQFNNLRYKTPLRSPMVLSTRKRTFLIVGGLYSVTALRKLTMRVTVYTKHRLTLEKTLVTEAWGS